MALLMVMTVCLLVYAALEYRLRQALRAQQERFPIRRAAECSVQLLGGCSITLSESMFCLASPRNPSC